MAVLEHLEPKAVFHFFEELCAIPHGSRNCGAISEWCVEFARARGLEHYRDRADNVIIIKEASAGYETAEPVILQGHLDMVCAAEPDCSRDLTREGLVLRAEGDWIFAEGTTLGGDDGIAVAMALAALDDDSLPHPRLEVVLTTDEEVGMLGAAVLDGTPLRGRQLINIDSEEEGIFTVSCAGGVVAECSLPLSRAPFAGTELEVCVGGLTGGHSGAEIHRGRANANMLLGRVLRAMAAAGELRLVTAAGGSKDNAIPTEASARLLSADPAAALAVAEEMEKVFRREFGAVDPGLFLRAQRCEETEVPLDASSTDRALCLLTCAPNGVLTMSQDIPGLVQTSLNLGVLTCQGDTLHATFCIRSSMPSEKEMAEDRLMCLLAQLGGTVALSGDYPAWEYRQDSPLRMCHRRSLKFPAQPPIDPHAGDVLKQAETCQQKQHRQIMLHHPQGAQQRREKGPQKAHRQPQQIGIPPGLIPQHLLALVLQVDPLLLQILPEGLLVSVPFGIPPQLHQAAAQASAAHTADQAAQGPRHGEDADGQKDRSHPRRKQPAPEIAFKFFHDDRSFREGRFPQWSDRKSPQW